MESIGKKPRRPEYCSFSARHSVMIWIQVRDVHAEHVRLAAPESRSSGRRAAEP